MAQAKQNNDRITLTTEDWEREALELIAEQGVQALAVEPLARRMGITKGSFYWHFSGRESLLEQARAQIITAPLTHRRPQLKWQAFLQFRDILMNELLLQIDRVRRYDRLTSCLDRIARSGRR